ncbi:hypothetical protein [Hoeflea sp.]|uniref:hypothetical protein n=1 Tax=Hoeflea sp. TaxID=1940281 RepID=UPI0019A2A729|nr:hypothetical protein [Hoeflea sp.]MBC7281876.1 hypothetical protein [Hoeflea sp.]
MMVKGLARGARSRHIKISLSSLALTLSSFPYSAAQDALPTGTSVISGQVAISSPSSSSLLIDQSSAGAIIERGGFSVGSGNAVHFAKGSGAMLNRVTGVNVSAIDGRPTATGSRRPLFLMEVL